MCICDHTKKMLRERKKLVGNTIQKFEVEGPPTTTKSEKHTTRPENILNGICTPATMLELKLAHRMA